MRQKNLITDVCLKVCRNGKEAPVNCMALAVSALSPSVLSSLLHKLPSKSGLFATKLCM